MSPPLIYICYSPRDEDFKDRLASHLQPVERMNKIRVWETSRTQPGGNRVDEIKKAINEACIGILLISSDFLNDNFIFNNELPVLLKRQRTSGMQIYPLIIRHCLHSYVDWLSELQIRPKNGVPLASIRGPEFDSEIFAVTNEIIEFVLNTRNADVSQVEAVVRTQSPAKDEERPLPIFSISAARNLIGVGNITKLNFLSLFDYEQSLGEKQGSDGEQSIGEKQKSDYAVIDHIKRPTARFADYVLQIDHLVECEGEVDIRDWLLIKTEDNPTKLEGKMVALLTQENNKLVVSLRLLFQAEDHYFLAAKNLGITSTIVINYRPGGHPSLDDYYRRLPSTEKKSAYQVRVIGEVIDHIRYPMLTKSPDGLVKALIRQVPVFKLSVPSAIGVVDDISQHIIKYQYCPDENVNFGVVADDDSMKEFGILAGDTAFICSQSSFRNSEIFAVSVLTLSESVSVLRRSYLVKPDSDRFRHVVLEAGNSSISHLVVMEEGVDVKTIKSRYKQIQKGKFRYYENAELHIAGKLVGLVRKDETGKDIFFEYADGRLSQVTF